MLPNVLIVTHCPSPGSTAAPAVHLCSKCQVPICVDFMPPMLMQARQSDVVYAVCEFCSLLDHWRYLSDHTRSIGYKEAKLISIGQTRL